MSGTGESDAEQLFSDKQLAYMLPASFITVYGYIILAAYYPRVMPGVLVLLGIFLYAFFLRS
jgi:hypothetical protein